MLNLRKMPSRTNVFATPTSLSLVSPPVYYPEAVHFQQNGLSLESLLAGQINPPEQQQWGGGVVHFSIPSQSHTHATTLESRWCALRPSVAQLVFFGEEQDAHRQTTAAALFPFRGRQEEDTSTTRNLSAASQPVQVQTHDQFAPTMKIGKISGIFKENPIGIPRVRRQQSRNVAQAECQINGKSV